MNDKVEMNILDEIDEVLRTNEALMTTLRLGELPFNLLTLSWLSVKWRSDVLVSVDSAPSGGDSQGMRVDRPMTSFCQGATREKNLPRC